MILFVAKTATKQERKNTRKGLMCLRNKEKTRKHDVCGFFYLVEMGGVELITKTLYRLKTGHSAALRSNFVVIGYLLGE